MTSIGKCTELCLTDLQHRTLGFNYTQELTSDQGTQADVALLAGFINFDT